MSPVVKEGGGEYMSVKHPAIIREYNGKMGWVDLCDQIMVYYHMKTPSAPPSGSPKCLGFGHRLTLCTINIYLLTFTYLLDC